MIVNEEGDAGAAGAVPPGAETRPKPMHELDQTRDPLVPQYPHLFFRLNSRLLRINFELIFSALCDRYLSDSALVRKQMVRERANDARRELEPDLSEDDSDESREPKAAAAAVAAKRTAKPRASPLRISAQDEMQLKTKIVRELCGSLTGPHTRLAIFAFMLGTRALNSARRHLLMTLLHKPTCFRTGLDVAQCFEPNSAGKMALEAGDFAAKMAMPSYSDLETIQSTLTERIIELLSNRSPPVQPSPESGVSDSACTNVLNFLIRSRHDHPEAHLYRTHHWLLLGLFNLSAKYSAPAVHSIGDTLSSLLYALDPKGYEIILNSRMATDSAESGNGAGGGAAAMSESFKIKPTSLKPLVDRFCKLNAQVNKDAVVSRIRTQLAVSPYSTIRMMANAVEQKQQSESLSTKIDPNATYEVYMTPNVHTAANMALCSTGKGLYQFYEEVYYDVLRDHEGNMLMHLPWSQRLKRAPERSVCIELVTMTGRDILKARDEMFKKFRQVEATLSIYDPNANTYVRFSTLLKRTKVPSPPAAVAVPSADPLVA